MSEWKEYKLEDFLHFNPTLSLKKGAVVTKITMDKIIPNCRQVVSDEKAPYEGGMKFQNNDTIMARITPCLENGKCAFISCLDRDEIAFGSTEYFVLRAKEGVSNPLFVYYLAISPEIKDVAIKSMTGTSGRQRAQIDVIKKYTKSLPQLDEQKKIAAILSSLDDKIETNIAINARLEELAAAIFKSWFIDFEPFADGEFIEDENGRRPKGWEFLTLGDITIQCKQKVINRTDVKVLSPINTGELVLSDDLFTKQVYSKELNKYIIVKPNAFAYNPARVNIGSIGINNFDFDGCVSPVYVVFETIPKYENFVNLFIKSRRFKDEVLLRAIGGVRQTLNYTDLSLISIVVPPIGIIEDFNKIYISIFSLIRNINVESLKLAKLRDSLLPRLMSGELIPE